MATKRKVLKLDREDPIPFQHLRMAEHLFAWEDFDYFPTALGYEVELERPDKCKAHLGKSVTMKSKRFSEYAGLMSRSG